MIHRTKIKSIHGAATVVILGGLLISGPAVYAQSGDVTPTSSSSYFDTRDSTGSESGTAVPSSSTAAGQDSTTAQPQHRTIGQSAAKFLDAISKHPTDRESGKTPEWRIQEDKAVELARDGHYDQALPLLADLKAKYPQNLGIATDYTAILGWAGHDTEAVAAYQSLAAGDRPDYLIDSIGHSYRNLHQPKDALTVYNLGLQKYPDNQSFVAGKILSTLETGDSKAAKSLADDAEQKFTSPTDDLSVAIRTAYRADAVALARAGDYKSALAAFASLHAKYPDDAAITGDYVAVLSWGGRDTEATVMFRTLPQGDVPDYVLDAAAHSYRNLHQPKQALDLYQAALDKDPSNVTYAVGVIYSLSDLGRSKEALDMARAQLSKHPEKPEPLVSAYVYIQRRAAIDMARAGHYDQALSLLRQLRKEYPSDVTEEMDYIAVLSWSGRDAEAVKEYKKVSRQHLPDYVLEAVGGSYRKMGDSEKALAVYRRGLKQSPRNEIFTAGIIRCLDDVKKYAEAEAHAKEYTQKYGKRLEVLLAGGEAAMLNNDPIEALSFYEYANAISPKNREALKGMAQSEDHLGASQLALKIADKHPGLLTGAEYRAMVGDDDATLVRWGPLEPVNEQSRYADTDRALASLNAHIAQWSAQNDPTVYPNILRARFDRLAALRDRQRMQDVVNEYNALVQEGVEVPAYAMEPVGEAYLYLREPEIARDIFLKVLEADPNDYEARRLLAYAYLEDGQYDESFATIDKVTEDEPVWVYLKGEPERQANADGTVDNHAQTTLDAASIRLYAEMHQEADDRVTPIVQAGPYDPRNRAAAGEVYFERGWFRRALEQFQIGTAIQGGHDLGNETGAGKVELALQNFKEAQDKANDLMQRYPENLGVQRLQREVDVYNMAEVDAHAGYNFAPSGGANAGDVSHGQGFDVGAELYSAPIDYNWRLFAGEDWSHEHEPNDEGIMDYSRTNAGVEYRKGDVTASIAPTFNSYDGNSRVGVDGIGKYTFNDEWSAGIAAELFSANTPLRALNAGVTADEYDANVLWRQSESRQVSFDAYVMPFSDGNFRTVEDGEYIERLYTDPIWKLDAEADMTSTQNNKDENRLYYNPSLDLLGLFGLRATQNLYQRYETLYEHSLLVMPGFYSQQHYGTSPAWMVRYEQRVHYNDTLNVGAGVNYTHQDYDGSSEDAVSLTVDAVERF